MSGTVADRRRLIRITAGNLRHHHIYIGEHYDFFPSDCLGTSHKSTNVHTNPIEIRLDGLNTTVETDIRTEAGTGKPRRMFRARKWVREFFEHHQIQTEGCARRGWKHGITRGIVHFGYRTRS